MRATRECLDAYERLNPVGVRADDGEPVSGPELFRDRRGVARIGEVGSDIFFREVHVGREELFPFPDRRALAGARILGLPLNPQALVKLAGERDFPGSRRPWFGSSSKGIRRPSCARPAGEGGCGALSLRSPAGRAAVRLPASIADGLPKEVEPGRA